MIGFRAIPGNSYDGYKLREARNSATIPSGVFAGIAVVDGSHLAAEVNVIHILRSDQKRVIKAKTKRHSTMASSMRYGKVYRIG